MFNLTGQGFYAFIEGPNDVLVNEASRRAQRKHPFTVDSVTMPVPPIVLVSITPFDRDVERVGKVTFDLSTGTPSAVQIVSGVPGQEQILHPVWTQLAYVTVGSNKNGMAEIPVRGLTAAFAAGSLPPGAFTLRVLVGKVNYDIKVEEKSRASIH